MIVDFREPDRLLSEAAASSQLPSAQLAVRIAGRSAFSQSYGFLDPETRLRPIVSTSLFDLASLTKLYSAAAFMRLVEQGILSLDQPLSQVLPAFRGLRPIRPYEDPLTPGAWVDLTGSVSNRDRQPVTVDAAQTTFRQILRHSSGLPAWRPLKNQSDAASARLMAINTFYSYVPDSRILYSDIGFVLLGLAIEAAGGPSLDRVIEERVTSPLGLYRTRFLPIGSTIPLEVAPTEYSTQHNRHRMGEVHDETAYRLGGVAGHAGLFSTADEVARFGQSFLTGVFAQTHTGPLTRPLSPVTIAQMTANPFSWQAERRGLGFDLWSTDPLSSGNPFSQNAFGHTGFTGTSLWIDPDRKLVVALLTNSIYTGRQQRAFIRDFRIALHRAVVNSVDSVSTLH